MTNAEKADYNREYYRKHRQYWLDYAKTGHGIGRQASLDTNSGAYPHARKKTTSTTPTTGGYKRGAGLGIGPVKPSQESPRNGSQAIKWDWTSNSRKTKHSTADGRPMYEYDRLNASHWSKTRNGGKSLDNAGENAVEASWERYSNSKNERSRDMAFGDYMMRREQQRAGNDKNVRPRTVNIPRGKLDRLKQSASKTVNEIKEEARFAINDAKNFVKKVFDEVDYQVWNAGDGFKKFVKKIKKKR